MKITYNWLKNYIDVPWEWPELVERLTMAGLEREGVVDQGALFDGVVVGQVNTCSRHPNADRLSVCQVDLGETESTIVCGAPNVAAGQKVAVIRPGSSLPDGSLIEQVVIRGVESSGMICSEVELGIGADADGILVLADDAEIGESFSAHAGLDDVILDFEVTPNRPDCLSVIGIAREVRALTGLEISIPTADVPVIAAEASDAHGPVLSGIEITDPAGCPRYVGRVLRGVRVGPSPHWLQQRLQAVGQRPINNVVDVTNFVMLEMGQPLHAFDLNKIDGGRIVVRSARAGESLRTLDDNQRELDEGILVIADADKPVALAGIMGGADSEVSAQTTDVLLEAAYFDPTRVRHGASRLGLTTEASMRFERGADIEAPPRALDRVAHLLGKIANARACGDSLDAFPGSVPDRRIAARVSRINQLLATDLDAAAVRRVLELLSCRVEGDTEDLTVAVPTFRPDLEREVDLVEEVGRIHGFDNIPASTVITGPIGHTSDATATLSTKVRHRLTGLGLDEVVTNTIVEVGWLNLVGASTGPAICLANPPIEGLSFLRPSLVPSLLDVVRRNFNQGTPTVAAFELGKCFSVDDGEQRSLTAVVSGRRSASPWRRDREEIELLDLKGLLEAFIDDSALEFRPDEAAAFRPGHCAKVLLQGVEIGNLGEVAAPCLKHFDIDRPVYIFELSFQALADIWQDRGTTYKPLARFPVIERDLAVVLSQTVSAAEVIDRIRSCSELIESVDLFDLYEGDRIQVGRKSLAFNLRLRSSDTTLEDGQANQVIDEILATLKKSFDADLRVS